MVGGGGRGHLLSPVKVRQIVCVGGGLSLCLCLSVFLCVCENLEGLFERWRLENYLLLVWVAAAQTTLHLTAIFTPVFFFLDWE